MKKLITLSFAVILIIFSYKTESQVTVSGAVVGNGNYTTLGAAFTAINGGAQTGTNILITITASTSEGTASATLNAGTWTTLTINPSGGSWTISGATTAANPLINLNGADNVTIDGLNTGGNALTISNTTVAATAGTSTIRFIADATNNTIKNCTILGSSTSTPATSAGTILFSTGTTTGNDNNTISNNNIGPAGANLPSKGIFALGSTASQTIENSNITIDNNNIFDFFLATNNPSGIDIISGNDNWTISNNRIYQTGTRTFTTAASRYAGILINTTTGTLGTFTVTGNKIGFGSSSGTGFTTITGTSNEFRGIDFESSNTTTLSSIQGNIISGINQTTSRASTTGGSNPFIAIQSGSAAADAPANIGNVTGNTIGSLDGSSTIIINASSISVNTVPVVGILDFNFIGATVSNNNIGSITINNVSGTGTVVGFRGILVSSTTGINKIINSNTIGGPSAGSITDNIVGNYAMYGIQVASANVSMTSNIIRNFAGNANGAVVTMSGITVSGSTGVNTISQNTIYGLSDISSGVSTGAIYALDCTLPSTANIVERNFIHSLNVTSTATGYQIFGIVMRGAGTATYKNNMIRLGIDASGNSITTGYSFVGIRDISGSTSNYYHNSVYIGGSGVVSVSNTYCFLSDAVTVTRNFQDNIFYNARSNASGGIANVCIRVGGTAPNPAGLVSNYNVLYASGTNGAVGVFNAVTYTTIAQWRTATGQDANSFSSDPQYIAPTGTSASVDLHINPSVATVIEGNGLAIGSVTNDFDGQTRSGLTPTDIGADAGNFIGVDLTGPAISYTLISNNSFTTTLSFTAVTITDASGVNTTSGTAPRVYYKRSGDANAFNDNTSGTDGWKYAQANGSSSPFDFTIDYSRLFGGTGVTTGNTVQYFVVAQDLAATPNVGINSGTFATTPADVNLAGAFPIGGTINSYQITNSPLSGTYFIGLTMFNKLSGKNVEPRKFTRTVKVMMPVASDNSGNQNEKSGKPQTTSSYKTDYSKVTYRETEVTEEYTELYENGVKYNGPLFVQGKTSGDMMSPDYATITAAITDLNLRGVSGAVTFLLDDGSYPSETFPLQFNNNIGGISSTNNVTLKPNSGVTTSISGSVASNALIKILSNYITIDGSNSGGTDRSLTIQNTSVTAPNAVLIGSTGTNPITSIALKNCNISTGAQVSSAVTISDAGTIGNPGYFNTVTIQNNNINTAFIGVYTNGGTTPQNGSNLSLLNNTLTSTGANAILGYGLYMQGVNGVTVSGNEAANMINTSGNAGYRTGLWLATGTINATVERNKFHDLQYTGTAGYGADGIKITTGVTGANVTIKNNIIYNITGDGDSYASFQGTYSPIGIYCFSTQTGLNIYNNSVYLYGNTINFSGAYSIAVDIETGTTADIRNNILVNNLGRLSATGAGAVALMIQTSNSQLTQCNNNCYSCNSTGGGTNNIGQIAGTNQTTLSGWRTATGKDGNSINVQPAFNSSTDLHIQPSDLSVSGRGTYLSGVNSDYDGDSRATGQSATEKPVDIGCDQYTPSGFTGNLTVFDGSSLYNDGNAKAIEVVSGSFTVSSIYQFPGVRTPFNTLMGKPVNLKQNNTDKKVNNNNSNTKVKQSSKDGKSGAEEEMMTPVNTPWIYWEINGYSSAGGDVVLRFYYNEDQLATILESDLRLTFWNGSAWENSLPQTVDAANNFIQITFPDGFVLPPAMHFAIENVGSPLPVTLSSFTAASLGRDARIVWVTETEVNNKGFYLERRSKTNANAFSEWQSVSFIDGHGNSNSSITYTYTDKKLSVGDYQYRLKQVDFNGNSEYHNTTGQSDVIIGKPMSSDMSQNYPNPSNPKSKIDYQIPFDGKVSIKIYDLTGREVATLLDRTQDAGYYTAEFDGSNLSSGVYFYRIIAINGSDKFTKTLKMILVK